MSKLFIIDYTLHGDLKSFIIRLDQLDAAQAWHWASCDAGIGHIPRNKYDRIKRTSSSEAEQAGIGNVQWRVVGVQPAAEASVVNSAGND